MVPSSNLDGYAHQHGDAGGWLDPRSVMGYSHDVPEYRRQMVAEIHDLSVAQEFRGRMTNDSNEKNRLKIVELLSGIDRNGLYESIGHFIFEFSQLEASLRHYLAQHMLIKEEHFAAVMSGFDFSRLVKAWEVKVSEALLRDPSITTSLPSLLKQCHAFNGDRVVVAHGLWMLGVEFRGAYHISRNSLQEQNHFREPTELHEKAEAIAKLRQDIEDSILWIWTLHDDA